MGGIPITLIDEDFSSLAFTQNSDNNNFFIPYLINFNNNGGIKIPPNIINTKFYRYLLYNGGLSLVVERTVVVRTAGVRFSQFAFYPHCF